VKSKEYIQVVFNLPLNKSFFYKIPQNFTSQLKIGQRVLAPFGKKRLTGVIVGKQKEKPKDRLKEIIKVIDEVPPLRKNCFSLARWISDYYFCSLGQTFHCIFPLRYSFSPVPPKSFPQVKTSQKNYQSVSKSLFPQTKTIFSSDRKGVFLVYPGEEKISFYRKIIQKVREKNKDVILIVPEINRIPPLKKALEKYFDEEIVVFHSKFPERVRYEKWLRMREGKVSLAIGTRSLIFAPFPEIGLVIIDEEENPSYKQKVIPRYHTREVAVKRGEIENFPVILISQSPSLESWYNVKKRFYQEIKLPQAKKNIKWEVVDMCEERNKIFSSSLKTSIENALNKGETTLLFLNRRGYANFLLCLECGKVIKCPNCNIGLSFHLKKELTCHYCSYREKIPRLCPVCGGRMLQKIGKGTQRVEAEAKKFFPRAKIKRVDTDVANSSSTYYQLINEIKTGKADILIGTQLAIKEEILSRVNLVGVVLIDSLLNLPDFRAGEYIYQLLTKIKNSINREGKIIIQTFNPTHYALNQIKKEDFYLQELKIREELGYPPFRGWIRILLEGKTELKVRKVGDEIKDRLEREKIEFLGPSPCPFHKLKGKYRHHLIIKKNTFIPSNKKHLIGFTSPKEIPDKLNFLLSFYSRGVKIVVDVDPLFTM